MPRTQRAWSLIALGGDRQYGGNTGYDDQLRSLYKYDSDVANHKQLAEGDIAIIRNRDSVLGVARVDRITTSVGQKLRQRCVDCGSLNIKARQTKVPRWRCVRGHTFSRPNSDTADVTKFEASYGDSFFAISAAVPISALKTAALRPNDQISIEELDLAAVKGILLVACPEATTLIADSPQP